METSDAGSSEHTVRTRARRMAILLPVLFLAVAGCDDDQLMPPEPAAGDLFARYAAVGNSITAGFQSGGINDSTQLESYAVLLAEGMGTEFNAPLLNQPGCPPPLTNVFTGEVVGGPQAPACAFRKRPIPTVLNNAAVPGAAVIDVLSNQDAASSPNELTTILLGGRTQMDVVHEVQPTFVSVWIGNNNVLGAALSGDGSRVTEPGTFATRYQDLLDELQATGAEGGVLVAVPNVTLIPHLSPGAAYWQADQQGALPPTYDVDASCAPADFGGQGESTLVPFGYGFGVLFAQASQGVPVELDCAADPQVLTPQEIGAVSAAIQSFNATIEAAAQELGWAFYDPNPALAQAKAAGNIPLFPDADPGSPTFGPCFSLDGVHPGRRAHALVAQQLAAAINEQYGTDISVDAQGASTCLGSS